MVQVKLALPALPNSPASILDCYTSHLSKILILELVDLKLPSVIFDRSGSVRMSLAEMSLAEMTFPELRLAEADSSSAGRQRRPAAHRAQPIDTSMSHVRFRCSTREVVMSESPAAARKVGRKSSPSNGPEWS
jgi:hypothetical protein